MAITGLFTLLITINGKELDPFDMSKGEIALDPSFKHIMNEILKMCMKRTVSSSWKVRGEFLLSMVIADDIVLIADLNEMLFQVFESEAKQERKLIVLTLVWRWTFGVTKKMLRFSAVEKYYKWSMNAHTLTLYSAGNEKYMMCFPDVLRKSSNIYSI